MEYRKGDKVIYLPTGEAATVTKVVSKELIYIRMESDREELPAFSDDIAPVVSDNRPMRNDLSETQTVAETFYKEELREGLYLIVQYKMGQMDADSVLPVFLYNHSNQAIEFDLNYFSEDTPSQQVKGRLDPGGIDLILHISFQSLEFQPTFEIDWNSKSDPVSKRIGDIIIRPAVFFKKYGHIAIINSTGSMYYVQPLKAEKETGSLAGYTRAERKLHVPKHQREQSRVVREKAEFDPVLDLHIEKLHPDSKSLKRGEILPLQLKCFDKFLEKAIRLKIQQVFIIHGLGNGKLKDEIATRLVLHPGVNTFKNEYHPSFGFGATEVWLY